MPAHAAYIPQPADSLLLDDEFDIFGTVPLYNCKPGIGKDVFLCDDIVADESDGEQKECA